VIPASRISPVATYFLDKLPLPDLRGSFNNYVGSERNTTNNWDISNKMDHYLNEKNRICGFYHLQDFGSGPPPLHFRQTMRKEYCG